jgi:hypothetical protein
MKMGERAKDAYDTYAHRMGSSEPWERLSDKEQMAWREVVELIEPAYPDFEDLDPGCECGAELVCPVCDVEKFAVKAETAGKPTVERR